MRLPIPHFVTKKGKFFLVFKKEADGGAVGSWRTGRMVFGSGERAGRLLRGGGNGAGLGRRILRKKEKKFGFCRKKRLHSFSCCAIIIKQVRKLSSAGRASALQAEGHRFDPYSFHHTVRNVDYAGIAQW